MDGPWAQRDGGRFRETRTDRAHRNPSTYGHPVSATYTSYRRQVFPRSPRVGTATEGYDIHFDRPLKKDPSRPGSTTTSRRNIETQADRSIDIRESVADVHTEDSTVDRFPRARGLLLYPTFGISGVPAPGRNCRPLSFDCRPNGRNPAGFRDNPPATPTIEASASANSLIPSTHRPLRL